MEFEKLIKEENVSVEDVTGRRFLGSAPSVGMDVIGRVNGELFSYGWSVEDPEEDWGGCGVLGVRIDQRASLNEGKPIILEGFGEWLPEEEQQNG